MKSIILIALSIFMAAGYGSSQTTTKQQFLVLPYETAADFASRQGERSKTYWEEWGAYSQFLQKSGVVRGGAPLESIKASRTIRVRNGRTEVSSGTIDKQNEQLGGYLIIEAANIAEAVKIAESCPSAKTGAVVVRPIAAAPNMAN